MAEDLPLIEDGNSASATDTSTSSPTDGPSLTFQSSDGTTTTYEVEELLLLLSVAQTAMFAILIYMTWRNA